jgi:hypothetical protein
LPFLRQSAWDRIARKADIKIDIDVVAGKALATEQLLYFIYLQKI